MYSTCLFCREDLGRNEALESFPLGRRVAYDPAKGRLWVVCRTCERWNLSPLETRWEAIEDAERAFRATPLRVSTDNIGLARVNEGLELVRIGTPPRIELAGWRYGDQFQRRRRRHRLVLAGGLALAAVPLVASMTGLALVGSALSIGSSGYTLWRVRQSGRRVVLRIPCDDGTTAEITVQNFMFHTLAPRGHEADWTMNLPYRTRRARDGSALPANPTVYVRGADGILRLKGKDALRPLAMALPHWNNLAGSAKHVREAVDLIGAGRSLDHMLHSHLDAANSGGGAPASVGRLPTSTRLALEMILHEQDETRALDGEMHLLEERWREAEEIAAIADDLLLPGHVDRRLETLKKARDGGASGST